MRTSHSLFNPHLHNNLWREKNNIIYYNRVCIISPENPTMKDLIISKIYCWKLKNNLWCCGHSYKLKRDIPVPYYWLLRLYQEKRLYQVKYQDESFAFYDIQSKAPQGNECLVSYSVYTCNSRLARKQKNNCYNISQWQQYLLHMILKCT